MTEDDLKRYRVLAMIRVAEIADEDRVLRCWLVQVRIFGWPLFVFSIVAPVILGSVALTKLVGEHRDIIIVILSLGASVAAALHKGLSCDAYQSGLRRAIQALRGLSEAYEAVAVLPTEAAIEGFDAAETRLREFRASISDLPPKRRRAFSDVRNDAETHQS